MSVIPLIRQGVLGVLTLFSLIVLVLSAYLYPQKIQLVVDGFAVPLFDFNKWGALGIAAGVLSLVSLPVMLVFDSIRPDSFTSMIAIELIWFFVLACLWAASGAEVSAWFSVAFALGCGTYDLDPFLFTVPNGSCQETQVVEALSWLNFSILLLYGIPVTIVAIIATMCGEGIWLSSVRGTYGPSSLSGPTMQYPMAVYNAPSPPQPQVCPAGVLAQAQNPSAATPDKAMV